MLELAVRYEKILFKFGVIALLLLPLSPEVSMARNAYIESLNKKVEVKKQTRWTLSDWLDTKGKVNLMDNWLAANSSANLFEFYLSYSHYDYEQTDSLSPTDVYTDTSRSYALAGFLSIFGIKAEQSSDENSINNQFEGLIRILGVAEQSTRMNVFYGRDSQDQRQSLENFEADYWGAELRFYLLSFLSLDGRYQKYLNKGKEEGYWDSTTSYGLNIDLGPVQLFGLWRSSIMDSSSLSDTQREGLNYGLRLYF